MRENPLFKFEPLQTKGLIFYWGLVVLYLGLIYYFSSLSLRNIGSPFPYSDKVVHLFEYAILAILLFRALYISLSKKYLRYTGLIVIILCFAYGVSDEFHQSFVPSRSSDIYDLLADTTGAIMGTFSCVYFLSMRNKR